MSRKPAPSSILEPAFFDRAADAVARDLCGRTLVRLRDGARIALTIAETEAYLGPHDLAAHSARGLTPRTRVMFGPPGHAYVYFVYGMHWCANVVTQAEGTASAVLLRALEPVKNVEGRTNGPALLCRAMGIDGRHNGHDLLSEDLYIARSGPGPSPRGGLGDETRIVRRPRIGVDYAGRHWARRLLRFYIRGNPFVSRK